MIGEGWTVGSGPPFSSQLTRVRLLHLSPHRFEINIKVWTRYVLATRFKNGYACAATGKSPVVVVVVVVVAVVVVLTDKHYTALLPPPGEQVPRTWTKETPSLVIDLSGAGKSIASVGTYGCVALS